MGEGEATLVAFAVAVAMAMGRFLVTEEVDLGPHDDSCVAVARPWHRSGKGGPCVLVVRSHENVRSRAESVHNFGGQEC